jgi:hypothetical protein
MHWGKACDTSNGWTQVGDNCVKYVDSPHVDVQPISNLSTLEVDGAASSSQDTVYFSYLGSDGLSHIESVSQDSVLGLAQGWKFAEYNIFAEGGDDCLATLNPGSSIVVAMDAWAIGPGQLPPPASRVDPTICVSGHSITAEWNSLSLLGPCCFDPVTYGYWFYESNTDGTNRPLCLAAKPTTQASIINVDNGGAPPALSVEWQNGGGEATAVFMAATSTGAPAPVDGTVYFQDSDHSKQGWQSSTFGQGTQIGTSGWYCVYNGPGNGQGGGKVTIDGLQPGTTYRVMAVTYNTTVAAYDGSRIAADPAYLTTATSNNPANRLMLRPAPDLTVSAQASFEYYSTEWGKEPAMKLTWQALSGSADGVIVVVGEGQTQLPPLVNGIQVSCPNTQDWNFGAKVGNSGWRCIYRMNASNAGSLDIYGLLLGHRYWAVIVPYNELATGEPTYSPTPANAGCLAPLPVPALGRSFQVALPILLWAVYLLRTSRRKGALTGMSIAESVRPGKAGPDSGMDESVSGHPLPWKALQVNCATVSCRPCCPESCRRHFLTDPRMAREFGGHPQDKSLRRMRAEWRMSSPVNMKITRSATLVT